MRLVYIDILRHVRPELKNRDDVDFVLFGGFDAMKIETQYKDYENSGQVVQPEFTDVRQLKLMHEQRHSYVVSALYDRQPLFMCSTDDDDPKQKIFSTSGGKEIQPLVMTLFQTDKTRIRQENFHILIDEFREIIEAMITQLKIDSAEIEFQVFWNLGESDFVVIFRANSLRNIGRLLHGLRSIENAESDILVMSTCSHCAFPYATSEASPIKLKQNVIDWMNRETKQGTSILSLVNTSYGFNLIHKAKRYKVKQGRNNYLLDGFLFGEWDYRAKFDLNTEDATIDVANFFMRNYSFSGDGNPDYNDAYHASYSIPVVQLTEDDISLSEQIKPVTRENEIADSNKYGQIKALTGSMRKFTEAVKALLEVTPQENWRLAYETLVSFTYTLEGLGKYLIRLDVARFEYDLFCYVKEVFFSFTRTNESYTKQIESLHKFILPTSPKDEKYQKRCREQITNILREYIEDTSKLISGLQHLFAVIVVSPHTFLETYGSSMRSMVAAYKLVVAYQGIVKFLDSTFFDRFVIAKDGTQTAKDEQQTIYHRFLVLPYRKAASQSSILFRLSDPTYRLTQIQIDYSLMFNVQDTIFMLLHEAAHIVGDRQRIERYGYFVKAVFRFLFGKAFGSFLQDTERTFSCFLNETNRIIHMDATHLSMFTGQIVEIINGLSDRLYSECEKNYNQYCVKNIEIEDAIALENRFFDQVGNQTKIFIRDALIYDFSFPKLHIWERALKDVMEAGQVIAGDLVSQFSDTGNPDLRAAIYLRELYFQYHDEEKTYIDELIHDIRDYYIEIIDILVSVFRDIFADIFAIRILGLNDGNRYLGILPQFTGVDLGNALAGTSNIIRLMVVFGVCFPDKDLYECLSAISVESNILDNVKKEMAEINALTYLECIFDYAKLVDEKIGESLRELKQGQQNAHIKLKNMYEARLEDVLDGMYYFWKYSME